MRSKATAILIATTATLALMGARCSDGDDAATGAGGVRSGEADEAIHATEPTRDASAPGERPIHNPDAAPAPAATNEAAP